MKVILSIFFFLSLISLSISNIPYDLGNDFYYIGFNDYHTSYLEGDNYLRNGIAYNSYLLKDEKIIIIESMYYYHLEEWLEIIENSLEPNRSPDYLLLQHFELDNIDSIKEITKKYPNIKLLGSSKCFDLMFKYTDFSHNNIQIIKDGEQLTLGKHTLSFIATPLYHWPDIMLTLDNLTKIMFTNKLFSKFGSNGVYETWDDEPRRFYYNILGQNSKQVQLLLEKMQSLQVAQIYPVHGTIMTYNMAHPYYLYGLWSRYKPEAGGVVLVYNSIYGNTKVVIQHLVEKLKFFGEGVVIHDIAKGHLNFVVSDAFKYSKLVLASPTYGDDIMPKMKEFIEILVEKKFQKRVVGFIENGQWNPVANKIMKNMMEKCQHITFLKNSITIKGKMVNNDWFQIDNFAKEMHDTNPADF